MDIIKFTAPHHIMEFLRQPFNMHGKTYATNGVMMIESPLAGDYPPMPAERLETFKMILESMQDVKYKPFEPIRVAITPPDPNPCRPCNGTGKAAKSECKECEGVGEVDAETDYNTYHDLECKSCNGDGYIIQLSSSDKCEDCGGSGESEHTPIPVKIDGVNINYFLLRMIDEPGTEVARIPAKNMLAFRSGDQRGVIMGMWV